MKPARTGLCRAEDSRLLVIDIQTRLMAAMPAESGATTIDSVNRLMDAAALLEIPTVISEHCPDSLGHTEPAVLAHCPPTCDRIEKTAFPLPGVAAFDTLLSMTDRHQVVICGAETHVCVLQSALQLQHNGFEVFVVADAVCSRHPCQYDNALARLSAAGVSISHSESVIFEWVGDATHPAFRDVLALIRHT